MTDLHIARRDMERLRTQLATSTSERFAALIAAVQTAEDGTPRLIVRTVLVAEPGDQHPVAGYPGPSQTFLSMAAMRAESEGGAVVVVMSRARSLGIAAPEDDARMAELHVQLQRLLPSRPNACLLLTGSDTECRLLGLRESLAVVELPSP